MLLLATQAQLQMRAHRHPNLGRLVQPRHLSEAATYCLLTSISGRFLGLG